MSFPAPVTPPDWSIAQHHLASHHPAFQTIIAKVGPCTLAPYPDHFLSLARAISGQQISITVAAAIFTRFRNLFPKNKPTPKATLTLSDNQLRAAGFSRQKIAYLRDLAAHFTQEKLAFNHLTQFPDDQVITLLTQIHGVGVWTAHMFLIFSLNRPDILPTGDLGLLQSAQLAFHLKSLPTPRTITRLAEPWRPWRSIATWYLWRASDVAALKKQKVKA